MANEKPSRTSISKYEYTDEQGRYHGVVNKKFMEEHGIVCVGEFIKALLETHESDDWCGWIGIKCGNSEFGNPRIYYLGSTKGGKDGKEILPGSISSQVVDYREDWLKTGLATALIKNITYTDTYGKVDWLIEVEDPLRRARGETAKMQELARAYLTLGAH